MNELLHSCLMMLGWFVMGLIFIFCVCLLLFGISLSILCAKAVYDYVKGKWDDKIRSQKIN